MKLMPSAIRRVKTCRICLPVLPEKRLCHLHEDVDLFLRGNGIEKPIIMAPPRATRS